MTPLNALLVTIAVQVLFLFASGIFQSIDPALSMASLALYTAFLKPNPKR